MVWCLEPARHLGDLGIGQPAVGLADVDERSLGRTGPVVEHREGVVGQHAVAAAVPDLDADHHAVERGQGLLQLQPGVAAAARAHRSTRGPSASGLRCHAPGPHRRSARARRRRRRRRARPARSPACPRRSSDSSRRRRSAQGLAQQRLGRRAAVAQREHIEGDVDDRHLGEDGRPTASCDRGATAAAGRAAPPRPSRPGSRRRGCPPSAGRLAAWPISGNWPVMSLRSRL